MKWSKKYIYPPVKTNNSSGVRTYSVNGVNLPSVTTILQATQTEEKRQSLERWKQRVGDQAAENIKNTAANRGSIMHHILESYLLDQRHADLSDLGQQAGVMAQTIYDECLRGCMDEIWGTEITLYYPGLYAGACDLAGVYEGKQAILDFKQSNTRKKREWITDYFLQLAAYATAHNQIYGTAINSGVVLMCTKDNVFQKFTVSGTEFQKYMWDWLRRVDQYYAELGKNKAK